MQFNNRKSLLTKIHIAKKDLNLDDDTYRAMLMRITGKNSCKTMTIGELYKVLGSFESKGFKVKSKPFKKVTSKNNLVPKMLAIWNDMYRNKIITDNSPQALTAFARKMINRKDNILILNLQALNKDEAILVIETLKQWQKRVGVYNDR